MQRNGPRLPLIFGFALAVGSASVLAKLPTAPSPLFDALDKGDVTAVHRLEDQLHAHADTRQLDDAQLRYDLPNLLGLAISYEDAHFQKGTQGDLMLALRANQLARASALGLGDANAYLQEAIKAKKQLLPALNKSLGGVFTFDNGLDTADLEAALRQAPTMSLSWTNAQSILPLPRVSAMPPEQSAIKPAIELGEHSTTATILVNAAAMAPVWIVTTPDEPKPFGFTLLVKNIGKATATYHGHPYDAQIDLYLAPSVAFGPMLLHNAAVAVVHSYYVPPTIVIGMPMLRHFGQLSLNDHQLTLARRGGHVCQSGAPLSFASGPDLTGSAYFPASIGGQAARMSLELDTPFAVAIKPDFSQAIANGSQVDLAVGAWAAQDRAIVPRVWHDPRDALLGNGVLRQNTVSLDFGAPTPSLCIAKAASK